MSDTTTCEALAVGKITVLLSFILILIWLKISIRQTDFKFELLLPVRDYPDRNISSRQWPKAGQHCFVVLMWWSQSYWEKNTDEMSDLCRGPSLPLGSALGEPLRRHCPSPP